MAIKDQTINDKYAIYNGDCIEVMADIPDSRIHLSVYSPPFGGLYHYSSNDKDLSNNDDYSEFFKHYEFVVKGLHRITMPEGLPPFIAWMSPPETAGPMP